MEKNELKQAILDSQELCMEVAYIKRDIPGNYQSILNLNKIAAISGPRRCGKTFLMYQLIHELSLEKEEVIFLDFSEVIFENFKSLHFPLLLKSYLELFPEKKPWFFFDEIQEIEGFESGLKYLLNKRYKICITGSSSKMFTRELSSTLRGKLLVVQLYPLNFREFLVFKQFSWKSPITTHTRASLRKLLEEYLVWGGFPEVVLTQDILTKRNLIKSYIDIMLFRDIIERHGVNNIFLIESLFYRLVKSFTKQFSVSKIFNDYKSMGMKVSKDTLFQYLHYFEQTQFIFYLSDIFGGSTSLKKVYLVDNALYQRIGTVRQDSGKLLENAVFQDLVAQSDDLHFLHTPKFEADFVYETFVVQVCFQLNDNNQQREFLGLSESAILTKAANQSIIIVDDDRNTYFPRNPKKPNTLNVKDYIDFALLE